MRLKSTASRSHSSMTRHAPSCARCCPSSARPATPSTSPRRCCRTAACSATCCPCWPSATPRTRCSSTSRRPASAMTCRASCATARLTSPRPATRSRLPRPWKPQWTHSVPRASWHSPTTSMHCLHSPSSSTTRSSCGDHRRCRCRSPRWPCPRPQAATFRKPTASRCSPSTAVRPCRSACAAPARRPSPRSKRSARRWR